MRLTNPLEEDPLLKELLKQLDRIETRRGFAKWKSQFLEQFEVHLEGTNVTKAGQKYHSFARRLDRMALLLKKLEGLISTGECSSSHCTVKARQSLTELQKALTGMIRHTEALVPGTYEMEREAGYTKFDMGAVLVRDGFVEYDRLCICNEILLYMKDITLKNVADRLLLEEMDRYWNKVQVFYQIMGTDLGLDKAILRCRKILRADDDEFFEITEAQASEPEPPRVKSLYNDDTESDRDASEEIRLESRPSQQEPPPKSYSGKNKKGKRGKTRGGDLDELDERQEPIPSPQRFEKVEIYGLDLPLRLIKISDELSVTDLSSVSDYDSWCWELELPEPTPPPPPPPTAGDALLEEDLMTKSLEKNEPLQVEDAKNKKTKKKEKNDRVAEPELPRNDNADEGEDEGTADGDRKLRYRWTGKDYYHGADAAGWRIAGTLKKARDKTATASSSE